MSIIKLIAASVSILGITPVASASLATPTITSTSNELSEEQKVASTDVMNDSYPGIPEKFFSKGDAYITGKISDYTKDLGIENITLIYINPLTEEKTVKTVVLADDGSFSGIIGMEAPGFITLRGGDEWLSARYYAEPSRTLYIEFDYEDMKRLYKNNSLYYRIGQKVSRFGGDTGEINRQISSCPLLKMCDVSTLAYEAVPSVAAEEINAIYNENKKITEDYINSNSLHPLAAKLIRNEVVGECASAFGIYENKAVINMRLHPDAPAIKENPDLSFYDWWKHLLTDMDEWFLTSSYMEGQQAYYITSFFPYLLDAEKRYSEVIYYDPIKFLKSKGATLTPEEEELAEWYASHVGSAIYLTSRERNDYLNKIRDVYSLAVRSGLKEEYLEFCDEQNRVMENSEIDVQDDVSYNVDLTANAIKRFTGKDETPLLWQAIQTYLLTGGNVLEPEDYSKARMFEIIDEIKKSNAITHPVFLATLTEYFEKAYSPKDFELPDDKRGRIIKEIIAPFQGKVILLDFWGTACGLCRAEIEESAEERKRNLDHPDYKRIFITSVTDSPDEVYNEYVAKYLVDETNVRLSDSDYRKVMDLFSFSSLPHYVLIDRTCKVMMPNFNYPHLHSFLDDCGITLN